MADIFKQETIIIREKSFRIANFYEMFTKNNVKIGEIKEIFDNPFTKLVKIIELIKITPFNVVFYDQNKKKILKIKRPFSLFCSKIKIYDQDNKPIGMIKYTSTPANPKLKIFDQHKKLVATVKGNFPRWNFKIIDKHNKQISEINKKFRGVGKEIISGADDYIINFTNKKLDHHKKKLILAATASIDLIFKDV